VTTGWAIVSGSLAYNDINDKDCNSLSGIRGYPDIYGWKNVGISTSANAQAKVVDGDEYFIVVRATNSEGKQFYANTNKFTAVTSKPLEINTRNIDVEQKLETSPKIERAIAQSDCPIDQAWRCNAAKVSVREYLAQFYGPPNYGVPAAFVPAAVADDDDDDDDDDGGAPFGVGIVILIAIAITLFFYILALAAMLLAGFGKEGGEFKTNVRRHENAEEF